MMNKYADLTMTQLDLPFGQHERDTTIMNMEASKDSWLIAECRKIARTFIIQQGEVTVDHVRMVAEERWPEEIRKKDKRFFGAVFLGKEFRKIGTTNTTRKTSHARPISRFALN